MRNANSKPGGYNMDIEHLLDDHTMLHGTGRWVDESYDDEYGSVKRMGFQLQTFKVSVWIDGLDYDITSALAKHTLMSFEQTLLDANSLERSTF